MLKTEKRKSRKNIKLNLTPAAFLSKTYEIIENPEYKDIVAWTSDGTAFVIKKPNEFSDKILPKYFKHNNMASFVRQLNMYDFHKCRNKNNENEFKHKMFLRGQKNLLSDIKRKTNETNGINGGLEESDEGETDKEQHKKEYSMIFQEVFNVKKKQENLENSVKILVSQNKQIISENMYLWTEMLKRQDAHDKKVDQLVYMVFSLLGKSNIKHNLPLGIKEGKDNISFDGEFEKKVKKEIKENKSESEDMEKKEHFKREPQSVMCVVQNNKPASSEYEKFCKKFAKTLNSNYNKKKKNDNQVDFNTLFGSYKNNMNVLQSVMDYMDSDSGSGTGATKFRNLESTEPLNSVINGKRPFQANSEIDAMKSIFEDQLMSRGNKKSKKNPKRKDFQNFLDGSFHGDEVSETPLNVSFINPHQAYNPYMDFYEYGRNETLFQNGHHPQVKMSNYIAHPSNPSISMITNYPNNTNVEANNNIHTIKNLYNNNVGGFETGGESPYYNENHNGLYIPSPTGENRPMSPSANLGLLGIGQPFSLENNHKVDESALNMILNSPRSEFGLAMRRKNSLFETHSTGKWSDDENYKMEIFDDQSGLSPSNHDNQVIKSINGNGRK